MKALNLVFGIVLTLISLNYWITVGTSSKISNVPIFYEFTFKLFPYMDVIITIIAIWLVIKGVKDIIK